MRLLAIDGAGPIAVAAWSGGPDMAATVARTVGGDADLLPGYVGACLDQAGWRIGQVDVIACAVGPGGFTSIRVAVAAARALALAAGLPVMAVTGFEAIAARARRNGMAGRLCVTIAGGRGSWFVQRLDAQDVWTPPEILAEPPSASAGSTLVGSGGDGALERMADASDVAGVAAARLAKGDLPMAGTQLMPLYLRGADAREGAGRSLLEMAGS